MVFLATNNPRKVLYAITSRQRNFISRHLVFDENVFPYKSAELHTQKPSSGSVLSIYLDFVPRAISSLHQTTLVENQLPDLSSTRRLEDQADASLELSVKKSCSRTYL